MFRLFVIISLLLGILGAVAGGLFGVWGYFYITRDLPQISSIQDFRPPAVSQVFARDGTLIAEFFYERRYPVKMSEVPAVVRQAFLAAEDASFYSHPGIDFMSILRALRENLKEGQAKQGGSTITQQVVKNLLLTPEKTLARKIKEAILSYRLEQGLTKDEIFEIYLNQIFFGNTAYGVKAAVRSYYRKELSEVTLAEAAYLAGLPKAPSRFSPLQNPDRARKRQLYVLGQMVKARFISEEQAREAKREDVKFYPAITHNIYRAPYFVAEVRRVLAEQWRALNPDQDGLVIHTTVDVDAYDMAERAMRVGLRAVDKRRGWRGSQVIEGGDRLSTEEFEQRFKPRTFAEMPVDEPYPAMVESVKGRTVEVRLKGEVKSFDLKDSGWASRRLAKDQQVTNVPIEKSLKVGDIIEVSRGVLEETTKGKETTSDLSRSFLRLDQTPDIEGAITLIDPLSGEVYVTIGGYDYGRSVFNRATQALRQPGSSFKPIVYLAAVDGFQYTPSTLVDARATNPDGTPRVFVVGKDQYWSPQNYGGDQAGVVTLRSALERSLNLVSADIVSRIGVDAVIKYAKLLGIESRLGRNLSISLGSSEVTPLEITRAYGPFAAKGVLCESIFINKIENRFGEVIFDANQDRLQRAKQVISEQSAFIMANMMKGVVQSGTATRVKALGRPIAGKTGTTNDQMDVWFIGYTPHWVAGVWVGFDQKTNIGRKETGGGTAAPIWIDFMGNFLNAHDRIEYAALEAESKAEAERLGIEFVPPEPLTPLDFSVPEGVDPYLVVKATGERALESGPGVIQEYFIRGTEPKQRAAEENTLESYIDSPYL